MNNLFEMENSNIKIFGVISLWDLFAYEIILAGYFLSIHKLDNSLSIQKQVPAYLWFAIIYISIEYLNSKFQNRINYSSSINIIRISIYFLVILLIILIANYKSSYIYQKPYKTFNVISVFPGSPAEEAGMKAGDQIIDIEGKPITTIEEMEEIVASHSGEEISISYIRDGVIYQKWLTSNIFKISLETMIGAQDVIYEDFYISKKLANKK